MVKTDWLGRPIYANKRQGKKAAATAALYKKPRKASRTPRKTTTKKDSAKS